MSDLIKQTLGAGASLMVERESGLFLLNEASAPVTVKIYKRGTEIFHAIGVGRGVKVRPEGGFDKVAIVNVSASPVEVEAFICAGDVDVQIATGLQVTVDNASANPVPVMTPSGAPLAVAFAGTVEPVLGVVTVDNNNDEAIPVQQQALSTIVDKAPVTVGTSVTALVSDATLKRLRVRNSHDSGVVAIGGAGVTLVNGAIQLQPGDTFIEEDAAGAAWYAISDTENTVVQVQGLK